MGPHIAKKITEGNTDDFLTPAQKQDTNCCFTKKSREQGMNSINPWVVTNLIYSDKHACNNFKIEVAAV